MWQKYKNCMQSRNGRKFARNMAGIYIHIPFCAQACHYCDFHFSTNTALKQDLIQAMVAEIVLQRSYLEDKVLDTIYFGGGTPSLLTPGELGDVLAAIYRTQSVSSEAEITLEANPDDMTRERLSGFRTLGINRLSIGIQSFDDAILKYLNRLHTSETAIRSVELARETGFSNVSIDLIYAIPGLSNNAWQNNIAQAVSMAPEHISAYTLTIEAKTTFGNWLAKGKIKPVDESLAAEQLKILMADLRKAGYDQYEISNFSKPAFESRHNSSYWKGEAYLGIGPSAHSYNKRSRQHNVRNNHLYVRSLKENIIPFEQEILRKEDHINEYILTRLRTEKGCNLETLKNDFGYDVMQLHGNYIDTLLAHNLILVEDQYLILTEPGKLLADKISSDLFLIS